MQWKVGDRVILDNLRKDVENNPGIVKDRMNPMIGREYVIQEVDEINDWVRLEEDPNEYVYSHEWFIPSDGKVKPKKKKITAISKKEINKKISEARIELKKKAKAASCANYAVIVASDKGSLYTNVNANDICHARLRVYQEKHKAMAAIDFLGQAKKRFSNKKEMKLFRQYADYVINRSVGKVAFIPRSVDQYIRHGILLNVKATATQVLFGVTALRVGSEKKYSIHIFDFLLKHGYSEGFAFLMAHSFRTGEHSIHDNTKWQYSITGNHAIFDSYMSLANAKKIADETLELPKGTSYQDKPRDWRVFESIKARGAQKTWGAYLKEELEKRVEGKMVWGEFQCEPMGNEKFLELCKAVQADLQAFKE